MSLYNTANDDVYAIQTRNGFVFTRIFDGHLVSARSIFELIDRLQVSYNLHLTVKGA